MCPNPTIKLKINSAVAIAEYIQTNYKINNPIKLQKLLFFLTLESLKQRDKLLFRESFEAWVFGPVVPEVYYYFRRGSSFSSCHVNLNFIKKIEEVEIKDFIDANITKYLKFSALELRDWAHGMTPWISSRVGYDEREPSRKKIKVKDLQSFAKSPEFAWEEFSRKKTHNE